MHCVGAVIVSKPHLQEPRQSKHPFSCLHHSGLKGLAVANPKTSKISNLCKLIFQQSRDIFITTEILHDFFFFFVVK